MSSTYPGIKEYSFEVNKISFKKLLADKVNSSNGWSLEKNDSIKRENEACYWASLFYKANEQDLEYMIKYCFGLKESKGFPECARIEVLNVIDYISKNDARELHNKDAEKLLKNLERDILNELAPACSSNP